MSIRVSNRAIRFKPGYKVDEDVAVPSMNHGKDWVLGALEEAPQDLQETIFIAKPAEFGNMDKNVWLDTQGAHVIYVMGKRRSGKSYTLGVLAESLALSQRKQAILIFDTMNVFWTMEHMLDSLAPADSSRTLAEWGIEGQIAKPNTKMYYIRGEEARYPPHFKSLTLKASELEGEDWASLFGKDVFSDPIGQLLAEVVETISSGESQPGEKTTHPIQEYTIDDMLLFLETNPRVARYESKTVEAVRRYLKAVKRTGIFSDQGIDLHEIFSPGRISVLLLRDLDPLVRGLIIGIIVKKIMRLRAIGSDYERRKALIKKRQDLSERDRENEEKQLEISSVGGLPRGWIIIDEAHNYIPNVGVIASKAPLVKYINEGRNIGLSMIAATQHPSGLDSSVLRNAGILVIHSMSMGDDIAEVKNMLNARPIQEFVCEGKKSDKQGFESLVRTLRVGYAIISDEMADRVFVAKIRPRLTVHGGSEVW